MPSTSGGCNVPVTPCQSSTEPLAYPFPLTTRNERIAKKAEPKTNTLDDSATLHKMHRALNRALLARIESGEATAAELAVAAAVLRTNGVISLPEDDTVEQLRAKTMVTLPFTDADERPN
jgi:hypothetical protein